jgi:hypothetical protein
MKPYNRSGRFLLQFVISFFGMLLGHYIAEQTFTAKRIFLMAIVSVPLALFSLYIYRNKKNS